VSSQRARRSRSTFSGTRSLLLPARPLAEATRPEKRFCAPDPDTVNLSYNFQLRVFANAGKFYCEQDLPLFLLLRSFVSPVRLIFPSPSELLTAGSTPTSNFLAGRPPPWHCRDESYFSRRLPRQRIRRRHQRRRNRRQRLQTGPVAPSENCAAEIAAQADKVITSMSVIVALGDEHPNSLSDTPQPPLRVSRAKFLNAFASR
jgi:hypothetical protein